MLKVAVAVCMLLTGYSSPHFSFFATRSVTMAIHATRDTSENARLSPVGMLAIQRPISISGTVGMIRASSRSVG